MNEYWYAVEDDDDYRRGPMLSVFGVDSLWMIVDDCAMDYYDDTGSCGDGWPIRIAIYNAEEGGERLAQFNVSLDWEPSFYSMEVKKEETGV